MRIEIINDKEFFINSADGSENVSVNIDWLIDEIKRRKNSPVEFLINKIFNWETISINKIEEYIK
jgi:hypothetical protein